MTAKKVTVIPIEPPSANIKQSIDDISDTKSTFTDVHDIYTRTIMFQAMKPLFVSLRLFGLYYSQKYGSVSECKEQVRCHEAGKKCRAPFRPQRNCTVSKVYAWIVFIFYFPFGLKQLSMLTYGDLLIGPELFSKLTVLTWQVLALSNFVMFMMASHQYKGIPKFFIDFDDFVMCSTYAKKARKATWITMTISWIFHLFGSVVILYAAIVVPDVISPLFAPFELSDPNVIITQVLLIICIPHSMALWTFPVAINFLLGYILYLGFSKWAVDFKAIVQEGITTEMFIKARQQHQKLCRLVTNADDILSLHIAFSFVCNVGLLLFNLYTLMNAPDFMRTTAFYVTVLGWVAAVWINLIITCVSGVMVNHAAHSAYDDLQEIPPQVDAAQLQLFQSRLSGSSIGLSALGAFVIDKPAVLGMLSMLLTYFIVIIQFAPGSSSNSADSCNCSAILTNTSLH